MEIASVPREPRAETRRRRWPREAARALPNLRAEARERRRVLAELEELLERNPFFLP